MGVGVVTKYFVRGRQKMLTLTSYDADFTENKIRRQLGSPWKRLTYGGTIDETERHERGIKDEPKTR